MTFLRFSAISAALALALAAGLQLYAMSHAKTGGQVANTPRSEEVSVIASVPRRVTRADR